MKKQTVKTAKARAWSAFSKYIRLRDCLETTGWPDRGNCVTCQKEYPFEELQAGHFIPGRSKYVLFSEQGTHIQCSGCNVFKSGNLMKYWPYMEKKYGRKVIDELEAASYKTGTWSVPELQEIEQLYKDKETNLAQSQP